MKRRLRTDSMHEPQPAIQRQLNSRQALFRFAMRLVLLGAFASISTQGFATTLMALLMLSAIFCALVGVMRSEPIFGPLLTHWDEAAAYVVMGRLVSVLSQA